MTAMIDRIERSVKILASILGLLTAMFGVYQYYNDIEQEKINKSFEYFRMYHSGKILKTRSKFHEEINKIFSTEQPDMCDLEKRMIDKLTKDPHLTNYDIVIEFFDSVYKCSEVGGCNRETAIDLFAKEARHIWPIIYPVVEYRRDNYNSSHGLGLECLATRYEAEDCKR